MLMRTTRRCHWPNRVFLILLTFQGLAFLFYIFYKWRPNERKVFQEDGRSDKVMMLLVPNYLMGYKMLQKDGLQFINKNLHAGTNILQVPLLILTPA